MNKTAIVLFASSPEFEARSKSFSPYSSQKATQQISRVITQHFYRLAQQSSADTFLIDSVQQQGNNFAERITNTFNLTFAKGYENVICIGNDCPSLTLNLLENAITQVESRKIVLGPTKDGGAYLIAIPKSLFNASAFEQIKWQSSQTYHNLKNVFQSVNAEILETEILSDINKPEDILNSDNSTFIIKLLNQLINNFAIIFVQKACRLILNYHKADTPSLRGPPALSI
ncbi:DUF2064 domain-containing protein [Daejeonella sp.]|uniref:TIGR04282 family arsenosugar biosynthesis glycosyltransferase n=1 Tax=Daejeonella sp. TaxID=2805397 RepID=UPI0039837A96